MTNATLKALIDVYGTLVRAGWDEPDGREAESMAPDHEAPEGPSQAEHSQEAPPSRLQSTST
jgi:hypothetical protein